MRIDDRDLTHLRFLSASMAADPTHAAEAVRVVESIAERPQGAPLRKVLSELSKGLESGLTVAQMAKTLSLSKEDWMKVAGRTLSAALKRIDSAE